MPAEFAETALFVDACCQLHSTPSMLVVATLTRCRHTRSSSTSRLPSSSSTSPPPIVVDALHPPSPSPSSTPPALAAADVVGASTCPRQRQGRPPFSTPWTPPPALADVMDASTHPSPLPSSWMPPPALARHRRPLTHVVDASTRPRCCQRRGHHLRRRGRLHPPLLKSAHPPRGRLHPPSTSWTPSPPADVVDAALVIPLGSPTPSIHRRLPLSHQIPLNMGSHL